MTKCIEQEISRLLPSDQIKLSTFWQASQDLQDTARGGYYRLIRIGAALLGTVPSYPTRCIVPNRAVRNDILHPNLRLYESTNGLHRVRFRVRHRSILYERRRSLPITPIESTLSLTTPSFAVTCLLPINSSFFRGKEEGSPDFQNGSTRKKWLNDHWFPHHQLYQGVGLFEQSVPP